MANKRKIVDKNELYYKIRIRKQWFRDSETLAKSKEVFFNTFDGWLVALN